MNHAELFTSGRRFKVFFVEMDDEDRERVVSGVAESASFDVQSERDNVSILGGNMLVKGWDVIQAVNMTLRLVPSENGTFFKVEDFSNEG